MRTLFVGAGAVGGFFGAHLANAGTDVVFLVREARAQALRRTGLRVRSALGDVELAANAVSNAGDAGDPQIVVIACKAYGLMSAMQAIEPVVHPGVAILPLLNGYAHLEVLERRFPQATLWGGLVHLGVTLDSEGGIRHINEIAQFRVGSRRGVRDPRAEWLAAQFDGTPVDAAVRSKIEQDMWDKFVFVTTLAASTCLMRTNVGTIIAAHGGERLIAALLEECVAVAAAEGYRPNESQLAVYRAQLTQPSSVSKASMLRDIEQGRPTEADHLIGDMVARASAFSIDVPLLRIAQTHLECYERGRVAP